MDTKVQMLVAGGLLMLVGFGMGTLVTGTEGTYELDTPSTQAQSASLATTDVSAILESLDALKASLHRTDPPGSSTRVEVEAPNEWSERFDRIESQIQNISDELQRYLAGPEEFAALKPEPELETILPLFEEFAQQPRKFSDRVRSMTYRDVVRVFGVPSHVAERSGATWPGGGRIIEWIWKLGNGHVMVLRVRDGKVVVGEFSEEAAYWESYR